MILRLTAEWLQRITSDNNGEESRSHTRLPARPDSQGDGAHLDTQPRSWTKERQLAIDLKSTVADYTTLEKVSRETPKALSSSLSRRYQRLERHQRW